MTIYQIGDPDPVTNAYLSTGLPGWDACLSRDPNEIGYRVCQWPRTYPHDQHVAVAGYRVTAVWPADMAEETSDEPR